MGDMSDKCVSNCISLSEIQHQCYTRASADVLLMRNSGQSCNTKELGCYANKQQPPNGGRAAPLWVVDR